MASRALVIGPGEYAEDAGIPSHPTIRASAEMYGKVLAGDEKWGPDSCRVLDREELRTADGVMCALQEVTEATREGDILLVVYVGHGQYWNDVPGGQVHFSVNSSYKDRPWTWLSSWYVYRAMRQAEGLKVLIADCCYSNMLQLLGDGDDVVLPGVLGERRKGSCVFTAVKEIPHADAEGCGNLPPELRQCTPFSGHLLHVLRDGTKDDSNDLAIGLLKEAVERDMEGCAHPAPRTVLNDVRDGTALFTNRMDRRLRDRSRTPASAQEWISRLILDRDYRLDELLKDERLTGDIVGRLSKKSDETSRLVAKHLDKRANEMFTEAPTFARYWNRVEQALRA